MNAASLPWIEARRPALPWAGLGASLAAHGFAAAMLWTFWQAPAWLVQPEPVILDVRIARQVDRPARQTQPVPVPVRAALPAPTTPPTPAPTPTPTPTPTPAAPAQTLMVAPVLPLPQVVPPTPAPPTPAPVLVVPRQVPSSLVTVAPTVPTRTEPVAPVASASNQVQPRSPRSVPAAPAAAPSAIPVVSPAAVVHEIAAETERRWHLALLDRLRDMKRYPMAARRLGQEGVVLIEARIAPDGRLESVTVKRGSGFALLDSDALRLLEAAAEGARGQLRPERPSRLEIPIAYRLEP